jgi:hypothetical protein
VLTNFSIDRNSFELEVVMTKQRLVCAIIVSAVLSVAITGLASTGNFTSPLTNGVVLSVDINGGIIASNNTTTEGSNGPSGSPTLSPDPFGVLWSPWGGPLNTNGDGTQLPNSNGGGVQADSINKTFGGISATLSAGGTLSNYAANGSGHLNGRDRGSPSGATNDNDVFRDFEFAGGSGSNVQGTNYLQLSLSGLIPGSAYKVATYSFDGTGTHTTNWTATSPTISNGLSGWWAATPLGNNTFTAPSDMQQISWTGGTTTQAPAVFTLTADGSGTITLYGFGGTGSGQNSDTTYLDGFQIAVPEVSAFAMGVALVGMVGLTYIARRKHKAAAV